MNYHNEHIGKDQFGDALESPANEVEEVELDALVLRFGSDYNRPPDIVPREEMWHEIRQTRVPRRFIRQHHAWSALAAAVVLLGVGISIGVEMHSRIVARTSSIGPATPRVAVTGPPSPTSHRDAVAAITPQRAPELSVSPRSDTPSTYASDGSASEINGDARSAAYALATVRHFTAVEALLTSFQVSPHDARGDAQMASWARALLSQTRLLLDSPAAADPPRQKLLQDLELVLVQMTQLSPADNAIDREMIDGSVRHTDMITRLRTAVPAGAATHL